MAEFHYVIRSFEGKRKEGNVNAADMNAAMEKLEKLGTIVTIQEGTSGKKDKESYVDRLIESYHMLKNRIPLKTLVFFTRQLATMFSAGLTLERAIDNLRSEEKHKKFKNMLKTVSEDIKKGLSLSEALSEHPGAFSKLYVALVKAGEVSGTLHTILTQLADYLEAISDMRRKVMSALYYPIFIFFFLIMVTWGLITFIVPLFANVYKKFNAELPLPTQMLVHVSDLVKDNIVLSLLGIFAVFLTIFLFNLTDRGKYFFDWFKMQIPVFGSLVKNSIYGKFSRTFSILLSAGITVVDAIKLVMDVVGNSVIEKGISYADEQIKQGSGISYAFRKSGKFPPTLLQLMQTGEETGELDTLLMKTAEFYDKITNSIIDRLTSLIEPLIIIMMGVVVGGILVVIYLPIFSLGKAIQQGLY